MPIRSGVHMYINILHCLADSSRRYGEHLVEIERMFRLVQAITVPYDVMQHCFDRNMISMFIATTWINMYSSNETAQRSMLVGIPWIATQSIMHRVFVYLCVCRCACVCVTFYLFFYHSNSSLGNSE